MHPDDLLVPRRAREREQVVRGDRQRDRSQPRLLGDSQGGIRDARLGRGDQDVEQRLLTPGGVRRGR